MGAEAKARLLTYTHKCLMIRIMDTLLPINEVAKLMRRTVKTLQRWDRDGVLTAQRAPSGRRWYSREAILRHLGIGESPAERQTVAYCRVSSQAQKPDLKNQRRTVEEFCAAKGLANVEFIEEIGGGLNFKRKRFLALVDGVIAGNVSCVVLAHKDRLARFGFELLQHLCKEHDCELLVINSEKLSPEQEMVQDLMTIVHCFSSRLYGLRNYKKALKEALKP